MIERLVLKRIFHHWSDSKMNYRYEYPLYTSEDFLRAYGYLHYDISPYDKDSLARLSATKDFINSSLSIEKQMEVIARANIKYITTITVRKFLPDLLTSLHYKGYNCHVSVFNPDQITHTLYVILSNPKKYNKYKELCGKFNLLIQDTLGFSSIYFYIEPGSNSALEQCIKTKYRDHIFVFGKGIYVQLTPQDTFDILYDFVDSVFNVI